MWRHPDIYATCCRGQLKCDGTPTETRFRLSAKRTSPYKSAWASIQSTTGSRGVRISGSKAGYIMFRGSVKGTGYPLHSPVSPSLPPSVRHRVPSHFTWSLLSKYELFDVSPRTCELCLHPKFFPLLSINCLLSQYAVIRFYNVAPPQLRSAIMES